MREPAVLDFRYEIFYRPSRRQAEVRCWHIGSGITASAKDERECDARDRARERVEKIKREVGL